MFLKPFLTLLYMFRASKLEVSQLFHVQEVPDRPSKIPQHWGPSDKQARKLQATLVRNYIRPSYLLTGVKCRATSVADKELI